MLYGVLTLYEYLKDHNDTDKADWRRLKLVLSVADSLHESTMQGWARRTGSQIIEGYGMSETAASGHVNPMRRPKAGSFGWPGPDTHPGVGDPPTLEFVAAGPTGELVLSRPSGIQGYWDRPQEQERALVERAGPRWVRTR